MVHRRRIRPILPVLAGLVLGLVGCQVQGVGPGPQGTAPPPTQAGSAAAPATGECSDMDGPDIPGDMDQARELTSGTYRACIEPADGQVGKLGDVFSFTAPDEGPATLFVVRMQGDSGGPLIQATSYNADREKLEFVGAPSQGAPMDMWLNVSAGTTAFISAKSAYKGPYTITVEKRQVGDNSEPNEERAVRLELRKPHQAFLVGRINGAPETDLYTVKAKKSGFLSVVVSDVPAELTAAIEVHDQDNRKVAWLYGANKGATVRGAFKVRKGGVYALRVRGLGSPPPGAGGVLAKHATNPYEIAVTPGKGASR
ncbi:MAG: hypothetical protein KJO07_12160 [Deltaproteobacteria bacterium]|nr:hypothetical protein [Deltaproteobacteria bacterium]